MSRPWMATLLAASCAACAPELNWRELPSDGLHMAQMFPCKPVRQQRKIVVAGRDLLLVLHLCDAGGTSWAQARMDVGDPAAVGPVLEALRAAAQANVGATTALMTAQTVHGATPNASAGRLRVQGRAPDGRTLAAEVLLFAKGTVVVQVTALGARLPPDDVLQTFFESVRIDAQAAGHAPRVSIVRRDGRLSSAGGQS